MPIDENLPENRVVGECGSAELHDAHPYSPPEDGYCFGVHIISGNYEKFEWITLPADPPAGKEPGSGFWVKIPGHDEEPRWVDYPIDEEGFLWVWDEELQAPSSPQSLTAASAETPAPLAGGSRSRRAGIRIGRVVGTLVKGVLGLRKERVVEKNDGYVVDWDKEEGYKREDGI